MMGQLPPAQNELFYDFCLDQYVPQDHLLRKIDAILDLTKIRSHLSNFYSHTGRPSVDPELMIRMLIIGYCFGIRSERRICEEVHLNLAYRWFCRLGLEDAIPDHSTFSKNRHGRFRASDLLRLLFEEVVQLGMDKGLIAGEGFATDASVITADASKQHGFPGAEAMDHLKREGATRPVREYFDSLDTEDGSAGKPPKVISATDPQARWSAAAGPAIFAYSTNYLIDIENNLIVDVEPTPSVRTAEVDSTRKMIDRVEGKFGIKPKRLLGDTAYGSAPMLEWLVAEKQIEPHVPVWDKSSGNPDTYARSDFRWDAEAGHYQCPAGKLLKCRRRNFKKERPIVTSANTILYRSSQQDCENCEHKPHCCPNTSNRKIARSVYEESRDVARRLSKTPEYRQSRKDRKKVEMLFAHLKRILKLRRLRLRGLTGAHDEFLMAATAQNLRKLALLMSKPPPDHRIGAPA